MGSLYSDHPTWLHGVPAGVKLAFLALLGTGVFFTQELSVLIGSAACCVLIFASLGKATARAKPLLMGLVGGTAEWIFAHPDRISVTVSAADRLMEAPRAELAALIWGEVCAALGLSACRPAPLPAWQIVKEQRATFAATPAQDALRPPAQTAWGNLFLAGDWVQNGLPATIEGALRSGHTAARLALGQKPVYDGRR